MGSILCNVHIFYIVADRVAQVFTRSVDKHEAQMPTARLPPKVEIGGGLKSGTFSGETVATVKQFSHQDLDSSPLHV